MQITGTIKVIGKTKEYGENNFQKREFVVTTGDDKYPQHIPMEFVKDKCSLLDNYKVGEVVTVDVNLLGREWTKDGKTRYFLTLQAWKIAKAEGVQAPFPTVDKEDLNDDSDEDLPF